MKESRVPLYERLPEIYRIKDEEQQPSGQLKNYLDLVEKVFGAIQENIESLYHDLFIETCDDWVIPYIGDLLGTTHLSGDPWTLRADVADTIALRRRKGTLGGIELLTYILTKWGVHCVELSENLLWNQHLNHQRPDEAGKPPYANKPVIDREEKFLLKILRTQAIRAGTVTLRDPALLSLLNTPFDPFAHTADLKPPVFGNIRYNLPNLAIFLWRLVAYRIPVLKPKYRGIIDNRRTASGDEAIYIIRFDVHPLGEPVRLFNTNRFDLFNRKRTGADKLDLCRIAPTVSQIDEVPGPIPVERLSEDSAAGNPRDYVSIETYDHTDTTLSSLNISEVGLQLHLPESVFHDQIWPKPENPQVWSIRGANLCTWEEGLQPFLKKCEVAIDPEIGRIVIGLNTEDEGTALRDYLLLTYTYGAVGPVGAHPISRAPSPSKLNEEKVDLRNVNFHQNPNGLKEMLDNIQESPSPIVIEICDSMTHELDLNTINGVIDEDGGPNLRLNKPLIIRATDNQRPIIKLKQPLRFRPTNIKGATAEEQKKFNVAIANLTVKIEGLYITRDDGFPITEPLIARAALHSLEIIDSTLDPGGSKKLDGTLEGTRTPIQTSIKLKEPYGFADADDEKAFNQTPEIIIKRTITGPLCIDTSYNLSLFGSIIDAGKGVNVDTEDSAKEENYAVCSASNPIEDWGPPTEVNGITVFGRMRVESIVGKGGKGGIWVHSLEVHNNQKGCIKFSYFSGKGDRLPQNQGCVRGTEANLRFTTEIFGMPAYGQLAQNTDFRICEKGPKDDAMGAFSFLSEAHKWRNIQIRYREFMPIGIRPLLIPVT